MSIPVIQGLRQRGALGVKQMSKRIDRAIRDYQATVTPEAVKKALKALGHRGLINAASIRIGAASALQDVLAEEIAR
jgi:hypothetical protein